MLVQINYGDIAGSDAIASHVNQSVASALKVHGERVTRVEVHLRDDKQKRRGADDQRCLMEFRIAGDKPQAVESRSSDIYDAITQCAGKLQRAVGRKIERL